MKYVLFRASEYPALPWAGMPCLPAGRNEARKKPFSERKLRPSMGGEALFFCLFLFALIGWIALIKEENLKIIPPKSTEDSSSPFISSSPAATTLPSFLSSESQKAYVVRVIDGDTVELSDGSRLRYIGIETPETVDPRRPVECFGREAATKNRELVEGKEIEMEKDVSETDRYGRLLRYVYMGDIFVNDYLVRQGFAYSSSYPPDIKYQNQLQEAEREARDNGRGLWGSCGGSGKTEAAGECQIKGNISSRGEKIYHLPNCPSWSKTVISEEKGERWFCSEEEARDAGWRRAQNCPGQMYITEIYF